MRYCILRKLGSLKKSVCSTAGADNTVHSRSNLKDLLSLIAPAWRLRGAPAYWHSLPTDTVVRYRSQRTHINTYGTRNKNVVTRSKKEKKTEKRFLLSHESKRRRDSITTVVPCRRESTSHLKRIGVRSSKHLVLFVRASARVCMCVCMCVFV